MICLKSQPSVIAIGSAKKSALLNYHEDTNSHKCRISLSGSWSKRDYEDYNEHHQLIRSKADGHCFLHSVAACLHYEGNPVSMSSLIKSIDDEVIQNGRRYLDYGVTMSELTTHVNSYLYDKIYDNDVGDMIPIFLANALNRNILIIKTTSSNEVITKIVHMLKHVHLI